MNTIKIHSFDDYLETYVFAIDVIEDGYEAHYLRRERS
jgi:hypothetical protein